MRRESAGLLFHFDFSAMERCQLRAVPLIFFFSFFELIAKFFSLGAEEKSEKRKKREKEKRREEKKKKKKKKTDGMCCGNACGSRHCERHRGHESCCGCKCAVVTRAAECRASISGPSIDRGRF